jgi:hypothetical protein
VCYPFKEFADNSGHAYYLPKPQLSVPAGSSAPEIQDTAYYQLGWKAGKYLTQKANEGFTTWDVNLNRWV